MSKLPKILIIAIPVICIALFLISQKNIIDDDSLSRKDEIQEDDAIIDTDNKEDDLSESQDETGLSDETDIQEDISDIDDTDEIVLPLPEDEEAKKMVKRMRNETENAIEVVKADEDSESRSDFNYLTNIREIADFYITEEAFKSLGDSFNEFATNMGYKGSRFKVVNGKKIVNGVEFDVIQEDGNGQFHCEYVSKEGIFNYGIEKK